MILVQAKYHEIKGSISFKSLPKMQGCFDYPDENQLQPAYVTLRWDQIRIHSVVKSGPDSFDKIFKHSFGGVFALLSYIHANIYTIILPYTQE
jgi:hypothetical protein